MSFTRAQPPFMSSSPIFIFFKVDNPHPRMTVTSDIRAQASAESERQRLTNRRPDLYWPFRQIHNIVGF